MYYFQLIVSFQQREDQHMSPTTQELYGRKLRMIRQNQATAAERLASATRQAVEQYEKSMARFTEELEILKQHEIEPVVLVNQQTWRYFHSAERPCGRVTGVGRDKLNFTSMFLSEAEARHFEACSACGHRALYERHKNQAAS